MFLSFIETCYLLYHKVVGTEQNSKWVTAVPTTSNTTEDLEKVFSCTVWFLFSLLLGSSHLSWLSSVIVWALSTVLSACSHSLTSSSNSNRGTNNLLACLSKYDSCCCRTHSPPRPRHPTSCFLSLISSRRPESSCYNHQCLYFKGEGGGFFNPIIQTSKIPSRFFSCQLQTEKSV